MTTVSDGRAPLKAPSIIDVARLAGVSHQTVSRVLNNHSSVRPETRLRVQDAIRRLGYRPNRSARRLVTNTSLSLGLIGTDNPNHGPTSTMIAFSEAARQAGYHVGIGTISGADPATINEIVDRLLGEGVAGLVLIAQHQAAIDAVQSMSLDVPLVTAASIVRSGLHTVAIDQYSGARQATEHLIDLGHRRIAHVAGPEYSLDARNRIRGWRDALAENGLGAQVLHTGDWTAASGYRIGSELAARDEVTAVFSSNDQMAIGLMAAFGDAGVRVPHDVSVVGFDDMPEAAYLRPALTSVRQDFALLGADIMAAMLDLLAGHAREHAVFTEPRLVVRDSAAPPSTREPRKATSAGAGAAPRSADERTNR
ncbi:LacI family DNA-binding transcriptional regulator [Okibacterium endophyticum]